MHHSYEEPEDGNEDGKRDHGGGNGQEGVDRACGRHGLIVVVRVGEPLWTT